MAQSPEEILHKIRRAVRQACPEWLAADADDIAQAATLKVMARQREREENDPFPSSYLWRVAHSELVDEIRRRRRRREEAVDDQELQHHPDRGKPGPERAVSGGELGRAIRACLATLIDSRRRPAILHLMGHTSAEIAELLGFSVKRADNLAYRGLADLRRCLREKGYGAER